MLEDDERMSLGKALRHSGMSSCTHYYHPVPRVMEADPSILQRVEELALQRPFYGTRRMAAQPSRKLYVPVVGSTGIPLPSS